MFFSWVFRLALQVLRLLSAHRHRLQDFRLRCCLALQFFAL